MSALCHMVPIVLCMSNVWYLFHSFLENVKVVTISFFGCCFDLVLFLSSLFCLAFALYFCSLLLFIPFYFFPLILFVLVLWHCVLYKFLVQPKHFIT